ncbi:MAG: YkgJ family cysteine cluster protein [Desulfovibrionaceae bacterium]|nr:YkgJ family cysteine cluster protein [Desulfovibrionaceae bacterium]
MEDITASDKQDFVESLPEIQADEKFCFDCHPQVPCFNQCCAELTLPLTPYDVLRLCRHLDLNATEFINTYADQTINEATGFPQLTLRMNKEPGEPCPFVSPVGCMVYENRPSACRAYPLGRGTKMGVSGIVERFFMVHEEHCHGFDEGHKRTPNEWFQDQGLIPYNESNDRYMRLMSMVQATEKPLDHRLQSMCRLTLYHPDQFRAMIDKMKIFTRVRGKNLNCDLIMQDSLEGDAACLDFALDWMELVIFGQAANIERI